MDGHGNSNDIIIMQVMMNMINRKRVSRAAVTFSREVVKMTKSLAQPFILWNGTSSSLSRCSNFLILDMSRLPKILNN